MHLATARMNMVKHLRRDCWKRNSSASWDLNVGNTFKSVLIILLNSDHWFFFHRKLNIAFSYTQVLLAAEKTLNEMNSLYGTDMLFLFIYWILWITIILLESSSFHFFEHFCVDELLLWAVNSWCFARVVTVTTAHSNLYVVLSCLSRSQTVTSQFLRE